MLKKIYILNYYCFDRDKKKLVGEEWNPVGYYTTLKGAIEELKKNLNFYPQREVETCPWWITQKDERCSWNHVFEIWRVKLNTNNYENSIQSRVILEKLI